MFTENSGDSCGPIAVLVIASTMSLQEANRFVRNVGNSIASSASQFSFEGLTTFDSNDACYGPVTSLDSMLNISGNVSFLQNNIRIFGGAMFLSADSRVNIFENAKVLFDSNRGGNRGGAIYIDDSRVCLTVTIDECFMQFMGQELDFSLSFVNNYGLLAGDDVYGGEIDNCILLNSNISTTGLSGIFLNESHVTIEHENTTLSSISSEPVQVCFCNELGIVCCPSGSGLLGLVCPEMNDVGMIFPGQNLTVQLLAVGQMWGATPAVIRAVPGIFTIRKTGIPIFIEEVVGSTIWLSAVNATCTTLSHSLYTLESFQLLSLFPNSVCDLRHTHCYINQQTVQPTTVQPTNCTANKLYNQQTVQQQTVLL